MCDTLGDDEGWGKKNKARCRVPIGLGEVPVSVSKGLWRNLSDEMVFEHKPG